jgi:hypothetical protein
MGTPPPPRPQASVPPPPPFLVWGMDEWTTKTPNPICQLLFTIDLLIDFAALCLTDFIDWRYIHLHICIFDPACEQLPPWTKNNTVTLVPFLWPPPPPHSQTKCTVYTDSVCDWGGGGDVELCCRPYSAVVLHSYGQIQNLQNCYTTPPVKTTFRGWCL